MGWKVVTQPTTEPVTLTTAKLHCRVNHSTDDDLITSLIIAARQHAEQLTERALATQTIDLHLDAWPGDGDIRLPMPPLSSVTYVKYVDEDGVLQTIADSNYATDTYRDQDAAWLLPAYDYEWPSAREVANAIQIRYIAGYTDVTVPAAIKQYILASVAAMYAQREVIARSDRNPQSVKFLDGLLDRYRIVSA